MEILDTSLLRQSIAEWYVCGLEIDLTQRNLTLGAITDHEIFIFGTPHKYFAKEWEVDYVHGMACALINTETLES